MSNGTSNSSKIQLEVDVNNNLARDDFTSDALVILAKLDAHGDEHIALMLRFGETVARAKNSLGHSVERLLKIIADWKKATQGDRPKVPRAGGKNGRSSPLRNWKKSPQACARF
jgi:hypothetical protein